MATTRSHQLGLWDSELLADPVTGPRGRGLRALVQHLQAHPDVVARYRAKVWAPAIHGCHLWTGALNGRTGHAKFHVTYLDGRAWVEYGHRIAWVLSGGDLDDAACIRHTCDEASCQQPEHLVAGTSGDNSRDWSGRRGDIRGPLGDARGAYGRAKALQDAITRTAARPLNEQLAAVHRASAIGIGATQILLVNPQAPNRLPAAGPSAHDAPPDLFDQRT